MSNNETKEKNKSRTLSFIFTNRLEEMLLDIKQAKGYNTNTAVVHQALIEMHNRVFPPYAPARTPSNARERVARQREVKEAKNEMALEAQISLCEQLGGTVEEAEGGKVCVYYTYSHRDRYENRVPVEHLDPELLKSQYVPSKEKVLELQELGKANY